MTGVRMENPSTPLYIYARMRERRTVFVKHVSFQVKDITETSVCYIILIC